MLISHNLELFEMENVLLPESLQLEYKREINITSEKKRFLRTVIAFANGKGGKILFGVDDKTRTVVGFSEDSNLSRLADAITNSIMDNCSPQISHRVGVEEIEGKSVIALEVFPGNFTPYYLKALGPKEGTFVRIGATTRKADDTLLEELRFRGARRSLDTTLAAGAKAISEARLSKFLSLLESEANANNQSKGTLARPLTKQKLLEWNLITQASNKVYPNYGFELLEGTCRTISAAKIQCGLFLGKDRSDIRDTKIFDGALFNQIHEAEAWIASKLEHRSFINHLNRIDVMELPSVALRELIVNAVCHRSFFEREEAILIALYRDRLEITSPGSLPGAMTVDQAIQGYTFYRNPAIANVFNYVHLMEKWASGLPRVFHWVKLFGLRAPELVDVGNAVRITLYRPSVDWPSPKQEREIVAALTGVPITEAKLGEPISSRAERILEVIKSDDTVTLETLAKKLQLHKSQVRYELLKLKRKGLVSREGTLGGRWKLLL